MQFVSWHLILIADDAEDESGKAQISAIAIAAKRLNGVDELPLSINFVHTIAKKLAPAAAAPTRITLCPNPIRKSVL